MIYNEYLTTHSMFSSLLNLFLYYKHISQSLSILKDLNDIKLQNNSLDRLNKPLVTK